MEAELNATGPELLAQIQEAACLEGLAHIYPPERYPFPRAAVLDRWRRHEGMVLLHKSCLGFAGVRDEWLDGLYVRPVAWGTGVAAALLQRAVEIIASNGHSSARLWVLEDNHRARRFYEKHGWRPDGSSRVVEFPPYPLDIGYRLQLH